jgi:(2R)-sulfolactate sulfo-lyase subunit alpha
MMIHFVLHDAQDTVAVVVVEGISAGVAMKGWIMDEDRFTEVTAQQDIPIGHKVAIKDMATGDTVIKYGIDMGKVVAPIQAGQHAHVHNIKTKRW